MANTVYRSKVDDWLLNVLFASTGIVVLVLGVLLWRGSSGEALVAIPVLVAAVGLSWWIMLTTYYEITNHSLEIHSGPFHWTVPFRDLSRMQYTRDPGSSPALSLDRIRIQYTSGKLIMISPENRENFLGELRQRGIRVEIERS